MAAIALAVMVYRKFTHPRMRWTTLALLAVAVFSMGQTSKKNREIPPDFEPRKIKNLFFGSMGGDMEYTYSVSNGRTNSSGCNDVDRYHVGPGFFSSGFLYENLNEVKPNKFTGFGTGFHFTSYQQQINQNPEATQVDAAGLLYVRWARPNHDIKLGTHVGHISTILGQEASLKNFQLLYNMRFGPQNKAFVELGAGEDLPYGLLASSVKFGVGIGLPLFGIENQSKLRFGITTIADERAWYISPEIPVGRAIFMPTVRFGKNGFGENQVNYGLTLGLRLGEVK